MERMPMRLFQWWRAFAAVEPFGPRAEEYRIGRLAEIVAAGSARPCRFPPEDVFGSLRDPKRELSDPTDGWGAWGKRR